MSDLIEVFPNVDAMTLEVDDRSIFIRQNDNYQQTVAAVEIPRILIHAFASALFLQLDNEELKCLKRALCAAQAEGVDRG